MANNPLRKQDRILQSKLEKGAPRQSISLFDVDYAIIKYLEDVILPELDDNEKAVKIPVIYGNSERWDGARKNGVLRDKAGKIQLPMMMIRRTGIEKNESMPLLNRQLTYQYAKRESKDNRYDLYTLFGSKSAPKMEYYNIIMPDFVEITYECMGWTSYVEQLNTIIEALTFASEEYWGDKFKFKFNTIVSDYNIINEVTEGAERINRLECNILVKAYLLPEKFDGENTTKKVNNYRKIIFTTETDLTSTQGRLESLLASPSPYYDNKTLIDFLSLNNSKSQNPVANNTITFNGIKLIAAPPQLASVVTGSLTITNNSYDIKLFINGVRYYQTTHFTVSYVLASGNLTFNFIPANLGFEVDSGDEIIITGKFTEY